MMKQPEVTDRVSREMRINNDADIIARSQHHKDIFCHIQRSPTYRRMLHDMDSELSDIRGLTVLEVGCGKGEFADQLARRGVKVTGIDIASAYLETATRDGRGVGREYQSPEFFVMDVHSMTFPDNTFDIVVGNGILHHLDLKVALADIQRVLKPGGRGIFMEPLASNPLLRVFRLLTPKARTPDEEPLSQSDLNMISETWQTKNRYYGILATPLAVLTSIFLRPFPGNWILRAADVLEHYINRIKRLQPYNQYVLLNLRAR